MTTNEQLPKGNLEFYRKQAKALLKAAKSGEPTAVARIHKLSAELKASADTRIKPFALHDAQFAVARENGFASWPKFQESFNKDSQARTKTYFRPTSRQLSWYEDRVPGILSLHKDGLPETINEISIWHPDFLHATPETIRAAVFSEDDAKLMIAKEHGYENWDAFSNAIRDLESGKESDPFTQAFEAIKSDNQTTFQQLMAEHPSLATEHGTNGTTLLHLATSFKSLPLVENLIENGANVNAKTTRGLTPLHEAATNNTIPITELLLKAGANTESSAYGDGGTPLAMALFWGKDKISNILSRKEIHPHNLRIAAGAGKLNILSQFFDGVSLNPKAGAHRDWYRPHTGFPIWSPGTGPQEIIDEAFTYAARNGRMEVLDYLLQKDANINSDPYRGTALVWAVYTKRIDVISWLLAHGANINQRSTFGGATHGNGMTALHAAVEKNDLEMVKFLLDNGANKSIVDRNYDGTPFDWADHFGSTEIAELLKE